MNLPEKNFIQIIQLILSIFYRPVTVPKSEILFDRVENYFLTGLKIATQRFNPNLKPDWNIFGLKSSRAGWNEIGVHITTYNSDGFWWSALYNIYYIFSDLFNTSWIQLVVILDFYETKCLSISELIIKYYWVELVKIKF